MDNVRECVPGLPNQWKVEQIISDKGVLNEEELEEFMKLHECGVSYAIVAIVGPQSSGKSTLVNHLFHTNFEEMDALIGRGKTTKGIWIAKAPNVPSPCIMVMDVEGTDGKEKGQDDTKFEKWSALFCLVVADVIFINMWRNSIGLENAANRPLLKTIFEVMMQIFPSTRRKATLHFIIRDKGKSPMEILEPNLRTDLDEIWNTVTKTENFEDTPLREIFNVEVDALPSYEDKEMEFKTEVSSLREKVLNSIREAGNRGDVIPISGLSLHVKKLWETIKENKQLDLPTHKEMVAKVRCEEIAKEKLKLFAADKEWLKLAAAAEEGLVPDLGAKLGLIWCKYFSEYDSESKYFLEDVRNAKRQSLESDAFKVVHHAYMNILDHLRAEVSTKFESELEEVLNGGGGYAESVDKCRQSCEDEFDQRCCLGADAPLIEQAKWDTSFVRKELVGDIKNHALQVRAEKLPQVVEKRQARLSTEITKHLNTLFKMRDEEASTFTWAHIRSFTKRESDTAASNLCSEIASFGLNEESLEQKVHDLKQHARKLVVDKFKEKTESVLAHMNERLVLSLMMREDQETAYPEVLPRSVRMQCLKLLSTMAVIHLDESPCDGEVERLLVPALIDGDEAVSLDLDSCTWEEVPPEMVLITPGQCNDIWKQFLLDARTTIEQIRIADQRHANSETPANPNHEMLTNSESSELSDNSETPANPNHEMLTNSESSELPYWARVGTWLLGVPDFALFLWRHRDLPSAMQQLVNLVGEGVQLYRKCPEPVKEKVKDGFKKGYKREKRTYRQIMKKLKKALTKFYNFMMGIVGGRTYSALFKVQYAAQINLCAGPAKRPTHKKIAEQYNQEQSDEKQSDQERSDKEQSDHQEKRSDSLKATSTGIYRTAQQSPNGRKEVKSG